MDLRRICILVLVCLVSVFSVSCDGGGLLGDDETEEFKEDIRDYNNSFDGSFTIKVVDSRSGNVLDFTYYYYIEYSENGTTKRSAVKSKYCSGTKTFNYNGNAFYVTEVRSSGYYTWKGNRKMPQNEGVSIFSLVRK